MKTRLSAILLMLTCLALVVPSRTYTQVSTLLLGNNSGTIIPFSVSATGALNAVLTSGSITDAAFTVARNNIITTSTDGFLCDNTTAATVGVPVQLSCRSRWSGRGWDVDDAVSRSVSFFTESLPVSGNTVSGTMRFGYIDPVTAAITHPMTLTSAGGLTTTGFLLTGGSAFVPAASAFVFNGRSQITSAADGEVNFDNNAGTSFTYLRIADDVVYMSTTPTISSGFSTSAPSIAGRASAFAVTIGATPGVTGTVAFAGTFTNIPSVTCSNTITANLVQAVPTTTTVVLNGVWLQGDIIRCIAIGY